jgi:tetratricopeptide (TPR) repeat protein
VLLLAGVFLLHAGTWRYPLVFDDGQVLNPATLEQVAQFCSRAGGRCLSIASFWLTHLAAGLDPFWFRLGNVLLHGFTVLACFLFLDGLFAAVRRAAGTATGDPGKDRLLAFCGAALFAAHPVTVYAVTYLGQRSTVLATLFSLLALAAFVRALEAGKPRWLWLALLLYGAALMSKEHAIMLPAVAAAIAVLLGRRPPGSRAAHAVVLALAAVAGALIAYRLSPYIGTTASEYYVRELAAAGRATDSLTAYLGSVVTQAGLFFKYLLLWLLPWPGWMSVDLRQPLADGPLAWPFVLGVPAFLAWGAAAAVLLLRRGAAGLLGLAMLFPWLLYFTEFAAARIQEPFVLYRGYLWMAGLPLALPFVARRLGARQIAVAGVVFVLVLAAATRERIATFSSDLALWDDVVAKNTDLSRIFADRGYVNRSAALLRAGRLEEAMRDAEKALDINSRNTHAYLNRGTVLSRRGDQVGALADFDRAIALDAGFAEGHAERCAVLMLLGQPEPARASCEAALRIAPRMAKALVNRAVLNARSGRMPEAIADLDRALESDPGSGIALYNRGLALRASGRAAESARDLRAACAGGFAPACGKLP